MSNEGLYFCREGQDTPAVVFVHGLTCDHSDWSQQVSYLATRADCVSVDLRGHGNSARLPPVYDMNTLATDVIDVCNKLDITQAVFVGHSMGTRVIASLAQQAPELVKGLVFLDGSKLAAGDPEAARQAILYKLGDGPQTTAFISLMFSAMFVESSSQQGQRAIIERATNTDPEVFRQLFSNMFAWDAASLEPALRQITVPTTVLQSTTMNENAERRSLQTGEFPGYLKTVKDCVPHAVISVVPGIGHFTQLDAVGLVNEIIESLLETNPPYNSAKQ